VSKRPRTPCDRAAREGRAPATGPGGVRLRGVAAHPGLTHPRPSRDDRPPERVLGGQASAGGMLPKKVVLQSPVLFGIDLSAIVLALIGHGSAAAAGRFVGGWW
jgi:hypothetical protein